MSRGSSRRPLPSGTTRPYRSLGCKEAIYRPRFRRRSFLYHTPL
jgi:hypothetical protein